MRGFAVEKQLSSRISNTDNEVGLLELRMWVLRTQVNLLVYRLQLILCLRSSLTEELEKLGQLMVKQLKNRYNDPTFHKRFIIGVDRSRMKLYDVEASAQTLISDAAHVKEDDKPLNTFGDREGKKDFGGFKYD